MNLEILKKEYDKLAIKYGDPNLDSIYFGGCHENPDICFVFMNPTKRIVASAKTWKGLKAPWIGTKNIWDLFYRVNLLDDNLYYNIKNKKATDWDEEFANLVYDNIKSKKYFITNLGKCTQVDARALPDEVFLAYRDLLLKEISIVNPKIIILFGNQVSSIVLEEKIAISLNRKKKFIRKINSQNYIFYSTYYPIGNGRYNIDKAIDDINWIINNELK